MVEDLYHAVAAGGGGSGSGEAVLGGSGEGEGVGGGEFEGLSFGSVGCFSVLPFVFPLLLAAAPTSSRCFSYVRKGELWGMGRGWGLG